MKTLAFVARPFLIVALSIVGFLGVLLYGFTMFGIFTGNNAVSAGNAPYLSTIMFTLTGVWLVTAFGLVQQLKEGATGSLLFKLLAGAFVLSTLFGFVIPFIYAEYIIF